MRAAISRQRNVANILATGPFRLWKSHSPIAIVIVENIRQPWMMLLLFTDTRDLIRCSEAQTDFIPVFFRRNCTKSG
jgi:hypothetical protein